MAPNSRLFRLIPSSSSSDVTGIEQTREVIVNYNSLGAKDVLTLEAGDLLSSVEVKVETAFDATGEALSVGTSTDATKYVNAASLNSLGNTVTDVNEEITGATTIRATFAKGTGGSAGRARVIVRFTKAPPEVTIPALTSISVSPSNPTITAGQTQAFTATGNYSDGTTQDLTSLATWSRSNATACSINASTGVATGLAGAGTSTITATYQGVSGNATLVVNPSLTSITVAPFTTRFPSHLTPGFSDQYKATGNYSNGSTADLTGSVTWLSTDTGVATVSSGGLVTAVANGSTTIRATLGATIGNYALQVKTVVGNYLSVASGYSFSSGTPIFPNGSAFQVFPVVVYHDSGIGSLVTAWVTGTWASDNPSVATIDGAGNVSIVGTGSANLTCTYQGQTLTFPILAKTLSSLALVYPDSVMPMNKTQQVTSLIGTFSDASTQELKGIASYSSDDPIITAGATSGGLTSGALTGPSPAAPVTANIEASIAGVTDTFAVQVAEAQIITLDPLAPSIAVGNSVQLEADITYNGIGAAQRHTHYIDDWQPLGTPVVMGNGAGSWEGVAPGNENVTADLFQPGPDFMTIQGTANITVT